MTIYRSLECDENLHGDCNATVSVFDTPDGPNKYRCDCRCHGDLKAAELDREAERLENKAAQLRSDADRLRAESANHKGRS